MKKQEPVKIKGLKDGHGVTYADLKELLVQGTSKTVGQNKLIKKLSLQTIISKDTNIKLVLTENKREIIRIVGKFVGTKPLLVNGDTVVLSLEKNNSVIVFY